MSDEETKQVEEPVEPITKKDPRRIEQGKRLAMISKEAKERKMRARLEKEKEESWTNKIPTMIAIGSSCGFFITLFLFWTRQPKVERVVIREEKKKFVNNKNFEEL